MSPQKTQAKPSTASRAYDDDQTVVSPQKSPGKPISAGGTRTKDILSTLATALPIIGAIGTCFVWTVTNFYVGDLEVQTSHPYSAILVQVFDDKGHEATFHTPKFQLMPGNYHLVITADKFGAQHADTTVAFHAKTKVQVELPSDLDRPEAQSDSAKPPKRFWQFWRKK